MIPSPCINKPIQEAIENLTPCHLASLCDHTFLNRPESYRHLAKKGESPIKLKQIAFEMFLEALLKRPFFPYAVCVRPEDCADCRWFFTQHRIPLVIVSVVGFPDSRNYSTGLKLAEAQLAVDAGASEIDFVFPIELWKQREEKLIVKDIETLGHYVRQNQGVTKLILETSELSHEEIRDICRLVEKLPVDFVKTSTGFGAFGATPDHVLLMRENFSRGIKISGDVNLNTIHGLLTAACGKKIELNPRKIRIGESSFLFQLASLPPDKPINSLTSLTQQTY